MNDATGEGSCPHCGGSGWELQDTGDKSQVKRCRCYEEQRRKRLYLAARIPKKFHDCRLDNFEVYEWVGTKKRLNHSLSQPHEVAKLFTRKYPAVNKGLFFMGNCGVGKTHLTVAIISELTLNKGVPCLFYDFRDLLKEIRSSYDVNSPMSEFSVLEPVVTKEVLVLDDLGAWKITDWVLDIVNYIINKRYNENLITIITSNWMDNPRGVDKDTLADRIGIRLRSRLHEMCQEFEILADDYRLKKKEKTRFSKS
jgi:DNA replication protein DnaC